MTQWYFESRGFKGQGHRQLFRLRHSDGQFVIEEVLCCSKFNCAVVVFKDSSLRWRVILVITVNCHMNKLTSVFAETCMNHLTVRVWWFCFSKYLRFFIMQCDRGWRRRALMFGDWSTSTSRRTVISVSACCWALANRAFDASVSYGLYISMYIHFCSLSCDRRPTTDNSDDS